MKVCRHGLRLGTCALCIGYHQTVTPPIREEFMFPSLKGTKKTDSFKCWECGKKFSYPYKKCTDHRKIKGW